MQTNICAKAPSLTNFALLISFNENEMEGERYGSFTYTWNQQYCPSPVKKAKTDTEWIYPSCSSHKQKYNTMALSSPNHLLN